MDYRTGLGAPVVRGYSAEIVSSFPHTIITYYNKFSWSFSVVLLPAVQKHLERDVKQNKMTTKTMQNNYKETQIEYKEMHNDFNDTKGPI